MGEVQQLAARRVILRSEVGIIRQLEVMAEKQRSFAVDTEPVNKIVSQFCNLSRPFT